MADIRFYNTLTHALDAFSPIDPPHVYMYNCGPTVYDYAHIGNFKTFIFADVLRRFLELTGHDVHQVMNLTDVGHMTEDQLADGGGEDKMEVAAQRLKEAKKAGKAPVDDPDDPYQVAQFYTDAFVADGKALGLKVADEYPGNMPTATAHVPQMKAMIEKLIASEHAYVADDGAVYFSVESFPEYGKLSGNTLDKLRGGAGGRVSDHHQAVKRHPADFLLWKPDDTHLMRWDSPWGEGYPGWHIECSAMATELLGRDVIDIHTGGEDNIFPHHECEIAQTCGATGQESFARYWMHSRHLMVEGAKMSKSKGNFFTVRQILDGDFTGRTVDPAVLRFELLKANYRSTMNFTRKGLEDSASAVRKIRELHVRLKTEAEPTNVPTDHPVVSRFIDCLADDLNIAGALAVVFELVGGDHADPAESLGVLKRFDEVLGVLPVAADTSDVEEPAAALCRQIDDARAAKNYAKGDEIRAQLIAMGYDVKTTKDGTVAMKKLA